MGINNMKVTDFVIGKEYKVTGGHKYLGTVHVCSKISRGEVSFIGMEGIYCDHGLEWFELVEEPLQYGDKVTVNGNSATYFYLMTTPDGSIITTNEPREEVFYDGMGHLEVFNWGSDSLIKKVEDPVEDTTVEVTMSDIAKAMNINIDDLKIIN
jgi:hypothetical protein